MQLLSKIGDFRPAPTHPYDQSRIKDFAQPSSYNVDLELSNFTPINKTWVGGQRNGIHFNITDAAPHTDFVDKATRGTFHLSDPAPLPPEILDSVSFLLPHSGDEIRRIRRAQLRRLKALVRAAEPMHAERYSQTPTDSTSSTGDVNIAALTHLMDQWGLGGQLWLMQFVFGFDIAGAFSQSDLYPIPKKKSPHTHTPPTTPPTS